MAKEIIDNILLDYWIPPEATQRTEPIALVSPISFITTTYTFNSEFFEDECLTRFLTMETERENDGIAYLVEKEEKLAGLRGGIVIVDQNNCKGERSLRWDLVPCRVTNGVMHAKITLLHWSHCIRLIISSANITESGYCVNQEIFGIIDYVPNGDADLKPINDTLKFLEQLVSDHCGEVVKKRYKNQQAEIKKVIQKWGIQAKQYKKDEISLRTIFVSPKEKNALLKLKNIWDSNAISPAQQIAITSPFFDAEESENTPSRKIFSIMRQRGDVYVEYNVTAELVSDTATEILVNAPEFLRNTPNPHSNYITFNQLDEKGLNENGKEVPRPIHLKTIWINNDDINLYMVGSSNFTSAGLGLNHRNNYEANLVYIVSGKRNKKGYKDLSSGYLNPVKELDNENLKFRYCTNEDESATENEFINLPIGFNEAVLKKIEANYFLELTFEPSKVPNDFKIFAVNDQTKISDEYCIYHFSGWLLDGKKKTITIECNQKIIPEFLLVNWTGSEGNAYWPLIVEDQITLPPIEQLRNLPLEALIQILSSSQPLHRLLKLLENLKAKKQSKDNGDKVVDALKLVNSYGFLLQRTRRISYAMRALKERLEKPVYTLESLNWRLYGPIGVMSLKEAIFNEAKTAEERKFLLAELALELSRIQPKATDTSIKPSVIKLSLKNVLQNLSIDFKLAPDAEVSAISEYSNQALIKALNDL